MELKHGKMELLLPYALLEAPVLSRQRSTSLCAIFSIQPRQELQNHNRNLGFESA